MPGSDDLVAAAIIVLARQGIPPDVQEMLLRGDGRGTVPPGALAAAMSAALASRDKEIEKLRDLFRVDGEQHATHIKGLTARHEARITKYADAVAEQRTLAATAARERDEARRTEQKLHREMQAREGKLVSAAVKKERDFWLFADYEWSHNTEERRETYTKRYAAMERERDEARAECDLWKGLAREVAEWWESQPEGVRAPAFVFRLTGLLMPPRAALHPEGAKDGQS